jgi:hypothetical protein
VFGCQHYELHPLKFTHQTITKWHTDLWTDHAIPW